MNAQRKFAVIVAGGSGSRMGADIPKQFLLLEGKPILAHTINAFYGYDASMEIIVVLPKSQFTFWKQLCRQHAFEVPHVVVPGGASRFQSVKNGINAIESPEGIVAIHDGVRPFVTTEVISKSFDSAEKNGSGVVCVPLKDTIRKKTLGGSERRNRADYVAVQTPQTFSLATLRKACDQEEMAIFTDDANVVESFGLNINLVEGDYDNIKITSPEDLILAEKIMKGKKS